MTIDFFNLASKTADISVDSPYFTILYVLSAEMTLKIPPLTSTAYEQSHKSVIVNKVPFAKILLNPLT